MNKTKKITFIALLSALAIVCTLFEIAYPFAPWLKFDLSETVILLTTTLLGLGAAVITSFIKVMIQLVTGDSSPFYIGEITALVASLTFAISFFFTKRLNLALRLIVVSVCFTAVMVAFNFFISTPVYYIQTLDYRKLLELGIEVDIFGLHLEVTDTISYLKMILLIYVPFNFIKAFFISLVYILVEKPIKRAFDLIVNK